MSSATLVSFSEHTRHPKKQVIFVRFLLQKSRREKMSKPALDLFEAIWNRRHRTGRESDFRDDDLMAKDGYMRLDQLLAARDELVQQGLLRYTSDKRLKDGWAIYAATYRLTDTAISESERVLTGARSRGLIR